MSFDRAKKHLMKYSLDKRIIEFSISTATVREASSALGCTDGEIAKSLGFLINEKAILVIVAGDQKIDNAKFKNEFKVKAKMIPFDDVERLIGHKAGGVCPFGVNNDVSVYLDESLKKYHTIYPACGSHNSAVKLTIEELEKTSNYRSWVDVCKNQF